MATASLRPVADAAFPANWGNVGTGSASWDRIDDDPDSPDTSNMVQASGAAGSTVYAAFRLSIPSDLGSITAITVRTYYGTSGWVDDAFSVNLIITNAGGGTQYTQPISLFSGGISATQVRDHTLTMLQAGTAATKVDWDTAELRFGYLHSASMSTDPTLFNLYAAEVNVTYAAAATTPTINSPADGASIGDTTPSFDFFSSTSDASSIQYNVELATTNTWPADTVASFYADGHTAIINDNSNWTNPNNAADGSTSTFATAATAWNGALHIRGWTGPSGNGTVRTLRSRAWAYDDLAGDSMVLLTRTHTGVTLEQSGNTPTTTAAWTNYGSGPSLPMRPTSGPTAKRITVPYFRDYIEGVTNIFVASGGGGFAKMESEVTYNPDLWIEAFSTHDGAEFINPDTGSDTQPFNSGENIVWTVPAGFELTAGNTYYWRVRARNATGNGVDWSAWTTVRSFLVTVAGDVVTRQLPTFTLTAVPGTITAGPVTFTAQIDDLVLTAVAGTRVAGTATITAQFATKTLTPVAGTTSISVSIPAQIATYAITPQVGTMVGGPTSKAAQVATYTITPVVGVTTGGPVTQTGVSTSLAITPQVGIVQPGTVTKTAQIATFAFTPQVGTVIGGPTSVTAQIVTCAIIPQVGSVVPGAIAITAQVLTASLTAIPGAPSVALGAVNAQTVTVVVTPQAGVVTAGPATITAQVATFAFTTLVGTVTGGPTSFAAQIASIVFTPQVGIVTGGPVTKTAQIATATLTTLVGTVTGGPVTKTAQIVTVALTTLVGTVIPGTATVSAQLATLTLLPLAGSSGGNIGVSAQVAPLTLAPTGGALAVAQTVTAQTASVTLTPTSGVVAAGAVTKTAQIATVTLGLGVTALTPGVLTQMAQIASLAVTPGSTAFAAGTIQPSTISTVTLVAVPGTVIGGPVTKSATPCSVTLTPTPGFFILGTITVAAAQASASLTGSAGALAVGTLTVNGTTTTLALTGISGSSSGTLTQTASVANFTFTARTGTTIGGPTTKQSTTVTLALTPRANQMQLGNQTWAGTKGTLLLIGDSGDFDVLGVVFAGWGVPIA